MFRARYTSPSSKFQHAFAENGGLEGRDWEKSIRDRDVKSGECTNTEKFPQTREHANVRVMLMFLHTVCDSPTMGGPPISTLAFFHAVIAEKGNLRRKTRALFRLS